MQVRRGLSIRRVGVSDVVEIEFTAGDPVRSAAIVNSAIRCYINSRLDLQKSLHDETESHLRIMLSELRDKAFPAKPPEDAFASDTQSGPQTRARFREQQEWTDAYQTLYGRLLRQAIGGAGRDFSAENVQVITPAEPPLFASSRLILIIAVTLGGGGIGLGHALIKELTDRRIRTLDDLASVAGSHETAEIPGVRPAAWKVEEVFPAYLQPAYTRTAEAFHDATSRLAVRLQNCTARRSGWTIGIIAPHEDSGVSSIAVHLARAIAESGQRTLLLDANWQKRSTGQVLLSSSQSRKLARGLCTIDLDGDLLDILVLRATQSTSELNASLSIIATLDTMRAEYDCVIVDFSAATQTADIEAGVGVVNQVVAVAEARRTTTDDLADLLRKIPGEKVVSVVLNKI